MYKYTHFIPENIAPVGTTKIIVRNSANQEICNFPLGNLTPPTGDKLYSFMAISDAHIGKGDDNNEQADLANALEYANKNCDFTCICGDLTEDGIKDQLDEYKDIVDNHTPDRPVYAIAGNHENYSNRVNSLGENYLVNYTGQPLYYSFTKGDDVFIMVGHYGGYAGDGIGWLSTEFVSTKELQWLYETLEANRNKRCFIFNHVFPSEHKVGNPKTFYSSVLPWKTTDGFIGEAYISLLKHYKNTILFHGHSHGRFSLQEKYEPANHSETYEYRLANYSDTNEYRSVHIPSLSVPRDVINGSRTEEYAESEGYIVDVYDGYIILNGRDFGRYDSTTGKRADGKWLPIATYKIDTTLQTIEANTFTDSTGTIKTQ